METGQLELIGEHEVQRVEEMILYRFHDKSLPKTAIYHRAIVALSNQTTLKNQQLEFLGDSILSYVVSRFLCTYYPERDEGFLSKLRSRIIDNRNLARVGRAMGIERLVMEVRKKNRKRSRGRLSQKVTGDIFEALVGAVYQDGGIAEASALIVRTLLSDIESLEKTEVDYKTNLQEWCQKKGVPLPSYMLLYSVGPEHDKTFSVSVRVDEIGSAIGTGNAKKEAEQDAARKIFEIIDAK